MKKKKTHLKSTGKSTRTILAPLDSRNWVSESTVSGSMAALAATDSGSGSGSDVVEEFYTLPIQINEPFTFLHKNLQQKKRKVNSKALFELQYKSGKDPCVVNVTIRLNFIAGSYPENLFKKSPGYRAATDAEVAASITAFPQGITAAWSDKFQLCCKKVIGRTKVQTPQGAAYPTRERHNTCCPIRIIIENHKDGDTVGVFTTTRRDSTQNNWNMTDPGFTLGQTAAHEIGHFLGNAEEYGETTELKGPTGINPYGQPILDPTSVMGATVGKAYERHYWRILKEATTTGNGRFEGASLKKL